MGSVGLPNPFRIDITGHTTDIPDGIRITEIHTEPDGNYVELHWTDLEPDELATCGHCNRDRLRDGLTMTPDGLRCPDCVEVAA